MSDRDSVKMISSRPPRFIAVLSAIAISARSPPRMSDSHSRRTPLRPACDAKPPTFSIIVGPVPSPRSSTVRSSCFAPRRIAVEIASHSLAAPLKSEIPRSSPTPGGPPRSSRPSNPPTRDRLPDYRVLIDVQPAGESRECATNAALWEVVAGRGHAARWRSRASARYTTISSLPTACARRAVPLHRLADPTEASPSIIRRETRWISNRRCRYSAKRDQTSRSWWKGIPRGRSLVLRSAPARYSGRRRPLQAGPHEHCTGTRRSVLCGPRQRAVLVTTGRNTNSARLRSTRPRNRRLARMADRAVVQLLRTRHARRPQAMHFTVDRDTKSSFIELDY